MKTNYKQSQAAPHASPSLLSAAMIAHYMCCLPILQGR